MLMYYTEKSLGKSHARYSSEIFVFMTHTQVYIIICLRILSLFSSLTFDPMHFYRNVYREMKASQIFAWNQTIYFWVLWPIWPLHNVLNQPRSLCTYCRNNKCILYIALRYTSTWSTWLTSCSWNTSMPIGIFYIHWKYIERST